MTSAWAQRQEALLHDCVVSPDVFEHIVERLRDFVVPYQHAIETAAGKRNALNFSPFVARQYWRKRQASSHHFQAHCVANGASSSDTSGS
jgi:hypothetical protein